MKQILLLVIALFIGQIALLAQGQIKGKVTDTEGEPILFGNVALYKSGSLVKGTQTDFDGNYLISNVDAGTYDLEVSYIGYAKKRIEGIQILGDQTEFLNVELAEEGLVLDEVEVVAYKKPLFAKDETSSGGIVTGDEIKSLGLRSVNQVAATTAGVSQNSDGGLNIRGGRTANTVYFIDGQRVRGNANLPPVDEFEQIQILTGGVSAKFGDVIGGVVSLTSKGPANKFSGSLSGESSYGLDPYGFLRVNGNMSGPILKKRVPEGEFAPTILGYRINAQYQSNLDDGPPATDIYRVNDETLSRLQANPTRFQDGITLNNSEFVTDDGIETLDYQPNEDRERLDVGAKLDAYLGSGIDVTLSGQFFDRSNRFTPNNEWRVFNTWRNPEQEFSGYRGSFRFRQRLGDKQNDSIQGFIRNVSYTLQLGFDRDILGRSDWEHRDNIFNYGYYGQFDFVSEPSFEQITTLEGPDVITTFNHADYSTVLTGYTPGADLGINSVLSNYNPKDINNINQLVMRNGQNIQAFTEVWGLYQNVGQVYNLNERRQRDIYQFDANASFDIVPARNSDRSHNIQFGILYEERVERRYAASPRRLWITMRQLANGHLGGLDTDRLVDRVIPPGATDSVDVYAQDYALGSTDRFPVEIRKLTGDPINRFTNVEGLDPDLLSLDLFSARELNDANVVSYYGYDYAGNPVGRETSFDDFFRTEEGRTSFAVAPNNPIYQAAYIQDKFSFDDIIFRVGVRVDRYDANTKVLKDPYSLKNIMTAGEFYGNVLDSAELRPANIEEDYKVYVEDAGGTKVRAFRDGDTWFRADGTQVNDGSVIFGGQIVQPRFTNPGVEIQNLEEFSNILDQSFEDYEPQVNVMPRLSFSFPISDEANFFAHYDVLVQRPTSNTILTPLDFFYWEFDNRTTDNVRNNSNLKPQKTVDYEVGFQQKLTNYSALKVSAFYKEMRDMIQWRTYLFNPEPLGSYQTYDNQDFGTVKGFTFTFDQRRKTNLQLNASYTLQFADGTGSNPETQRGISERGNLRNLFPLSFDERHRFVVVADYRYGSGKKYNGPRLFGRDVLANTGLNVQATLVTGRPYTAKLTPRRLGGDGTVGSINGARLPSQFTINARLDRDFTLGTGENALNINVFFRVSNLLNTLNVLRVYPATGSPYDDGYLTSSLGKQEVRNLEAGLTDINSFRDLYDRRLVNPNFFAQPRRMFLGAFIVF